MKTNTKKFQLVTEPFAFFRPAVRFFVRKGKVNLAKKLVFDSFSHVLFKNLVNKPKTNKRLYTRRILYRYTKSFFKARILVRFSPRFIRKRYREVPTGAKIDLQKRRVWSALAKLVRHSRQNSRFVLKNEINFIFKGSRNSAVLRHRDDIYKKAEKARVYLRRARLPYYKIRKKPRKQKPVVKAIKYYWQLRTKLYKRPKKILKYTPWLSKDELFF
jgi:hypothetical protein